MVGTISRKRFRKCTKETHQFEGDDPFSRLTDDIIVSHILSRLPLEDAVRSSVLSRRWENLWTDSIGPKIIVPSCLDGYIGLGGFSKHDALKLASLFASGISHILKTYRTRTLEELIIRFGFDLSSSSAISNWVEYAFRKGVTRLELDFSPWGPCSLKDNFTFPSMKEISAWHAYCDSNLHQPVNCAGMYNLRDICLKYVNISSEVIDFILSKCPSLERLCVWWSRKETKVSVSRHSVRLKSLEFVDCCGSKVKISSPSLVSLHFSGRKKSLCLEHAPLLSELSIGHLYCSNLLKNGFQNFSYISQLKRLTLDLDCEVVSESISYPLELPQLIKLEQLDIIMRADAGSCLLWPIVLIKASPLLWKFSVKLSTLSNVKIALSPQQEDEVKSLRNATQQIKHQCLRQIEVRGFRGLSEEVELVRCLISISEPLEQLLVVPNFPFNRQKPHPRDYVHLGVERSRKLAQEFTRWLPPPAQLVVL